MTPIDPLTGAWPPRWGVGRVSLTVRDLAAQRDFYERVVGLTPLEAGERRVLLGSGELPLVELVEDRDAPPRPPRTTGLFHLAILLPDRAELARALRRLIDTRWPLSGASDHLVSEALYLGDPEGNGIEIYRDRPREDWRRDRPSRGASGGELRMATLPLDLQGLLDDLPADCDEDAGAPDGTRMGHVHLDAADLGAGERFYSGLLGFDVTTRAYPGALFLAAGGYHHHVGLNTWRGEGVPAPPKGALGLRHFDLVVPDGATLAAAVERLERGGAEVASSPSSRGAGSGQATVRDPAGNGVRLVAAAG